MNHKSSSTDRIMRRQTHQQGARNEANQVSSIVYKTDSRCLWIKKYQDHSSRRSGRVANKTTDIAGVAPLEQRMPRKERNLDNDATRTSSRHRTLMLGWWPFLFFFYNFFLLQLLQQLFYCLCFVLPRQTTGVCWTILYGWHADHSYSPPY